MRRKKLDLTWNVYREDWNSRKIEIFNVFNHGSFQEGILKIFKKKNLNKEELSNLIDKEARYYFWSRSEYEVVVTSWPPYIDKEELDRLNKEEFNYRTDVRLTYGIKIDIYDQLKLNWDSFINYVYNQYVS